MRERFRYRAFISYSHADEAWALWLHRALERYRVPARLRQGERSGLPKRLTPIFRDRDELPSAAELGSVIQQALRDSQDLIVICSPRAASSRWVNEEIRYFKSLGREGRVLALIVEGEPHAADRSDECFPPALCWSLTSDGREVRAVEPIAADAREGRDGRRGALLKLIAGLLGVGFDDLAQRERQRQFWQRVQHGLAAVLVAGVVVAAWQWFERYRDSQTLALKIERLHEAGRLALLDQQMTPAAAYLAEAYRLGRDTPALRFMLARALESVSAVQPFAGSAGGRIRRPAYRADGLELLTPVVDAGATYGVVWDVASGRERLRLQGLPAVPHVSAYLPRAAGVAGERLLVSGYAESTVYGQRDARTAVWDAATGEQLFAVAGHSGHFGQPVSADGLHLLTTEEVNTRGVQLRDAATGAVQRTLPHAAAAHAASFSADGRTIASGDAEGRVRLWDAASGRLLKLLPGQTATAIVGVAMTPDGQRAVGVSRKGDVRVWQLPAGELQLAFAADKSYVIDLHFDASGQRMLTVGRQGYKVWALERGTLLFARDVELDWQASGDLDGSGRRVVTVTADDLPAELWDVPSRRRISRLQFEPAQVAAATFSPRGDGLLLGGYGGGVARVQPLPGALVEVAQPPSIFTARFSPDGSRLATGGWDQQLRLWDAATGQALASLEGHEQLVDEALFSADGERLTTASQDGRVRLWNVRDGQPLATSSPAHGAGIDRLVRSADGGRLLSIAYLKQNEDRNLRLWDAYDLRLLHTFAHPAFVWDASFSPDGREIATTSDDGHLRLWHADSGVLKRDLPLANAALLQVGYEPADGSLWALEQSGTIHRLEASSGKVLERLRMPGGGELSLAAASPDGRLGAVAGEAGKLWARAPKSGEWRAMGGGGLSLLRLGYLSPSVLLSAGYDGSLRAWDTERAQEIAVLGGHDRYPWKLDLDGTRQRLVSGGLDGLARIWRVGSAVPARGAPLLQLQCRLQRQLPPHELIERIDPARCR